MSSKPDNPIDAQQIMNAESVNNVLGQHFKAFEKVVTTITGKPYAAPITDGRAIQLSASGFAGINGTPAMILPFHAGRVRTLIKSAVSSTVMIGSLSQLSAGSGYLLSTSAEELKSINELYAVNVDAAGIAPATVYIWAEYAVE